jgi:hypothetical protein
VRHSSAVGGNVRRRGCFRLWLSDQGAAIAAVVGWAFWRSNSLACRVGLAAAEEGLEALSRFLLGGEIACLGGRFRAVLSREQGLQSECLLHIEFRQLIAGLRASRAPRASFERAMAVARRLVSASMPSATWPCTSAAR